MASFDRDRILDAIDLPALCDELLGPRRGRGRSATWRCPATGHGTQTGKTPPVSVFVSTRGEQRWHCHACGAGGTAIDLVMHTRGVDVRDALEQLARQAGVTAADGPQTGRRPRPAPTPPSPRPPAPELEEYVAACTTRLWRDSGPAREWLESRCLPEAILRANRVGYDPGPNVLPRPSGLPRAGPAAVLPVFDEHRRLAYLQARYLDPERAGRKYDNPGATLAANPRVGVVRSAYRLPPRVPGVVVVCEGIPDALSAGGAGLPAAAVLGAALPDERTASRVLAIAGRDHLVIAFDADERGQVGAARLAELISERAPGQATRLVIPDADLNSWAQRAGPAFPRALHEAIRVAVPEAARPPPALHVDDRALGLGIG
ncbi:MAG: toprim domain-containing protein [Acidimicrobiia bacterium]